MPKELELTDFQKAEIVVLEPQFSHAEIGEQLNIQRPFGVNASKIGNPLKTFLALVDQGKPPKQ